MGVYEFLRFSNSIVDFCDSISPPCASDAHIDTYVKKQFISEKDLKMTILCDYSKHGFDGSGDDEGEGVVSVVPRGIIIMLS